MKWIKDRDFIRGDVPMTKFGQRTLNIAALEIKPGDRLLDIGVGTGSISIEAGLQGARVTAIDKSEEAIRVSKLNGEKFGVDLDLISGEAPKDLPDKSFNKCFVGGSGGNLEDIFVYLDTHLEDRGILVGSFIITKNAMEFRDLLDVHGYEDIECRLVTIGEENKLGMMMGQNPIYILKGVKND